MSITFDQTSLPDNKLSPATNVKRYDVIFKGVRYSGDTINTKIQLDPKASFHHSTTYTTTGEPELAVFKLLKRSPHTPPVGFHVERQGWVFTISRMDNDLSVWDYFELAHKADEWEGRALLRSNETPERKLSLSEKRERIQKAHEAYDAGMFIATLLSQGIGDGFGAGRTAQNAEATTGLTAPDDFETCDITKDYVVVHRPRSKAILSTWAGMKKEAI